MIKNNIIVIIRTFQAFSTSGKNMLNVNQVSKFEIWKSPTLSRNKISHEIYFFSQTSTEGVIVNNVTMPKNGFYLTAVE